MKASKDALKAAIDGLEGDDITAEQLKAALEYAYAQEGKSGEADKAPAMADEEPEVPAMEDDEKAAADKPEDEKAAAEEPEEPVDAAMNPDEPVDAADPVDGPPVEEPEDAATMALAPLAEALGTDTAGAAAALMEQLDAVVALLSGGMEEAPAALAAEVKALSAATRAHEKTIVSLTARAEKAEKALSVRDRKDAEREVDVLIAEGRLTDDVRDDFVELALSARDRFTRICASLPQKVPVGAHASGVTPPSESSAPIDESDPVVKELRRTLSGAKVLGPEQDAVIRKRLASRKRDQATA